jgi:hypothetical protein
MVGLTLGAGGCAPVVSVTPGASTLDVLWEEFTMVEISSPVGYIFRGPHGLKI